MTQEEFLALKPGDFIRAARSYSKSFILGEVYEVRKIERWLDAEVLTYHPIERCENTFMKDLGDL